MIRFRCQHATCNTITKLCRVVCYADMSMSDWIRQHFDPASDNYSFGDKAAHSEAPNGARSPEPTANHSPSLALRTPHGLGRVPQQRLNELRRAIARSSEGSVATPSTEAGFQPNLASSSNPVAAPTGSQPQHTPGTLLSEIELAPLPSQASPERLNAFELGTDDPNGQQKSIRKAKSMHISKLQQAQTASFRSFDGSSMVSASSRQVPVRSVCILRCREFNRPHRAEKVKLEKDVACRNVQ